MSVRECVGGVKVCVCVVCVSVCLCVCRCMCVGVWCLTCVCDRETGLRHAGLGDELQGDVGGKPVRDLTL